MVGTISTIIMIAFITIGAVGFLIGYSKGTFRSLLDLGFFVLNIFLSVLIATAVAKGIVDVDMIAENLYTLAPSLGLSEELTNEINVYLTSPELASKAVALLLSFISTMVMPIVFMVVFFVMGIILFIPKVLIQKIVLSKATGIGLKLGGGAIGLVTKIVSFAVLLIPLVGYVNYANDTIKLLNSEEQVVELGEIDDMLEEATDCVPIKAIHLLGGEALFNNLTITKVEEITVSLTKETETAVKLYKETGHFTGTEINQYGSEQVESIERIEGIINDAELVPALLANTLSFVATEWHNGNSVFGIEKPVIGTELQEAVDSTVQTLSTTTTETFKEDLCTIAEIAKYAIEDGVIQNATSEDGDILYVLETTDVISNILVELHKNERMRPILPAVTNGVVNYMYDIYDEVNGTITENHHMVDINGLTEEVVKEEGEIISSVIVELDVFLKSVEGKLDGEVIDILKYGDFAALGRAFNGIKRSYLFCDTYEFLLKTVLESKGCARLGILDEQFIVNAVKHDSDMEMMLVARQKITLMVISMHEGEELDYNNAIEALLANVTTGDADSIKSIVTEENLNSIGIKGESAHTISGLLTSMVNSIQKDELVIPEENVSKEAESAGKVITAVNSALENSEKDKNVFTSSNDDKESTSNISASELVSTTLESQLVSSMVIEATKDSEGNEVDDPYNVKDHLSENDIAELEQALGEEYANTEEGDEDKKEKLDAIAHIFGVDVSKFQ